MTIKSHLYLLYTEHKTHSKRCLFHEVRVCKTENNTFLSYLVQFHVYTMQLVSVLTELNYEHHSLNIHIAFHSLGFYTL